MSLGEPEMGQSRGEWVVVWGLGDSCAATTIYPTFVRYTHVGAHDVSGCSPSPIICARAHDVKWGRKGMIARAGHNMRTLILAILLLRVARAPPALSRERYKIAKLRPAARGRTGDGRGKIADKIAAVGGFLLDC